ncbi:phage tail protein [Deinococcus altitudinis]|uniref:phage tail protein n=1 Tax=Deinococcus altitudinis TaxID=468914 RepID=UPI0038921EDB
MSEPFLSEIRLMSFIFPPKGWALCDGQLLPINQYQALFSLLGATYGGDGVVTFALPDLRGRVPMHEGNSMMRGQQLGAQSVTLTQDQLPKHTHPLQVSSNAAMTQSDPSGTLLAPVNGGYSAPAALTSLEPSSVTSVGDGQPHFNMQPYLTMSFCIALTGVFPSPN